MPGVTIDQELNSMGPNPADPKEEVIQGAQVVEQKRGIDLSFLKTQTGPGDVESYLDHPLNFGKSKGLARIIRGLTGMVGALDLAIIDIFVGLLEFTKEKKQNVRVEGA